MSDERPVRLDAQGRRLFVNVNTRDRAKIKNRYMTNWATLVQHIRPPLLKELSIPVEDRFLQFQASGTTTKIDTVFQSLDRCDIFTVEHLVEAMTKLGDFGLATELTTKYCKSPHQERLLANIAEAERSARAEEEENDPLAGNAYEEEQINEHPAPIGTARDGAVMVPDVCLRPYVPLSSFTGPMQQALREVDLLYNVQKNMARLVEGKERFYEDKSLHARVYDLLREVSHQVLLPMHPRENVDPVFLHFFFKQVDVTNNGGRSPFNVIKLPKTQGLGILSTQPIWSKTITKYKMTSEVLTRQRRELSLLLCLRNPNIVLLAGVFISPQAIHVLLHEHGTGSNLKLCLDPTCYPDPFGGLEFVVRTMLQIFNAVHYLHFHQPFAVYHGNLSLSNVLMDEETRAIQLCGFSNATYGEPYSPDTPNFVDHVVDIEALGKLLDRFLNLMSLRGEVELMQPIEYVNYINTLAQKLRNCSENPAITIRIVIDNFSVIRDRLYP